METIDYRIIGTIHPHTHTHTHTHTPKRTKTTIVVFFFTESRRDEEIDQKIPKKKNKNKIKEATKRTDHGGATGQSGPGARVEIVGRRGAHERQLHVRVRVDAACKKKTKTNPTSSGNQSNISQPRTLNEMDRSRCFDRRQS